MHLGKEANSLEVAAQAVAAQVLKFPKQFKNCQLIANKH